MNEHIEVVTVTPEMAEKWLRTTNTHNRNVRDRKVIQFARDMENGNWYFNGDTIRFTDDDVLIDGQHRLMAIALSKVSQRFVIVRKLPMHVQETVDIGIPRSVSDNLTLRNLLNPRKLAGVARQSLAYEMGSRSDPTSGNQPTHQEILTYIEKNLVELEHAVTVTRLAEQCNLPAPYVTIGVAYYMCAKIDRRDAEHFYVTQLIEAVGLSRDDPAWALRRRFETEFKRSGYVTRTKMNRIDTLRYAFAAWNAFRVGRRLMKLQAPNGGWNYKNAPVPH